MFRLLFIIFCILPILCNAETIPSARIVAGKTVSEYTTPVAYFDYNYAYFGKEGFCSGVLIAPNKILTAAHCVADGVGNISNKIFKYTVKIGGKKIKIKKVVVEPDYNEWDGINDLAIITLAQKAPLKPWPIYLRQKVRRGSKTYFYGYGVDYSSHSRILKRGIAMIRYSDLGRLYSKLKFGMDIPCFGDDGGPVTLVKNGKEIGIVGIIRILWSEDLNCWENPYFSATALKKYYYDIKGFIKKEAPKAKFL